MHETDLILQFLPYVISIWVQEWFSQFMHFS